MKLGFTRHLLSMVHCLVYDKKKLYKWEGKLAKKLLQNLGSCTNNTTQKVAETHTYTYIVHDYMTPEWLFWKRIILASVLSLCRKTILTAGKIMDDSSERRDKKLRVAMTFKIDVCFNCYKMSGIACKLRKIKTWMIFGIASNVKTTCTLF